MATTTKTRKAKTTSKSPSKTPTGKQVATAAAVVAGVAAVGAGLFFAKEKSAEKPQHATLDKEGEFEIRQYPTLLVAETVVTGIADRKDALSAGFRTLADYIFAKSRDGEKIAMTAPVLSERADGDATVLEEQGGGWRVRFVMPAHYSRATLPPAPSDVTIDEIAPRRVGVVRFAGLGNDATLATKESELRTWLDRRGETDTGTVEYAFYDAPFIPGPLRRNEVLVPLA